MEAPKLKDTTENKYALQLSVYRCIFERHYNINISENMLVLIPPQNPSTFRVFPLPYYEDIASSLLGEPPSWMEDVEPNEDRDARLLFDTDAHEYTILSSDGTDAWTASSATTLVGKYFPEFDQSRALKLMRRGRRWNKTHPMWGLCDEDIKRRWKERGSTAAKAGTLLHDAIETYYKSGILNTDVAGTAGFKAFKDSVSDWEPIRSEWRIFSGNVAGTADMLYRKPNGDYVLVDWKFTKKKLVDKNLGVFIVKKAKCEDPPKQKPLP